MKRRGVIHFPDFLNECAVYLGKLRNLVNYDLNEKYGKYKRGDRSEAVNILGARAELVFGFHLFVTGVGYKMGRLLANRPLAEPDMVVEGEKDGELRDFNVDVKGVRKEGEYL